MENRLGFGYNDGLVDGLRAAWGARWIVTQDGGVDFVWDRQDNFGDKGRIDKLLAWLNERALNGARTSASQMLVARALNTREARPAVLYQDREGAIVGNTNASAGYLYVAAYRYEDLPEGHPTRGLEQIFALRESRSE